MRPIVHAKDCPMPLVAALVDSRYGVHRVEVVWEVRLRRTRISACGLLPLLSLTVAVHLQQSRLEFSS